jgi:phosphate starvation-inducible protein PhoH and related proteins
LKSSTIQYRPQDADNRRLANLCGAVDTNLRQIEEAYDVRIARRADTFSVEGPAPQAKGAIRALEHFHRLAGAPLSLDDIQLGLVELRAPPISPPTTGAPTTGAASGPAGADPDAPVLHTRRTDLQGRTPRQREYLRNILSHDITFGIGPAGTGKTYLAVACAVDALEREGVKRMVLTRPAVEAGERLGFLPGDLAQKVDPYLRPLYDALYDLMGFDRVTKMFERQAIEIAPLAYMRGRTLNHAFIILDEAQNTTPEQMKMFLTRIGFGSRAVVTGDATQIDLPRGQPSGLIEARRVLRDVRGIAFTEFDSTDVVRHPLVARIVDAYEKHAPRDDG